MNLAFIHFEDVWHVLPTIRLTYEKGTPKDIWAIEFVWLTRGVAFEWQA